MKNYQPTFAYVIKSGKRQGKSLESIMFTDYGLLLFMKKKMSGSSCEKRNEIDLHLDWLLQKGEDRKPRLLCPHCKQRVVKYFSVRRSPLGEMSIGTYYTCCEQCKEELSAISWDSSLEFRKFKFSELTHFHSKKEKQAVVELFKKVFILSCPLSKKKLFEFFSE